ncbi:MAG: DEAD/DEAH box helicase [Alphaproteobacteria bacterium]|nr:DEAD/DEAH box helicase [Alphaproteobacteria bacterium]
MKVSPPKSRSEPRERKLSRTHRPVGVSPVEWQRELRRQFGREQKFKLTNLGSHRFFSDFQVHNPVSNSSYRVSIRGPGPGGNFCSCPDYSTSELGTCKHIEFTLARLEKKHGAKAAFARGYRPAFSELYLRNDGQRKVYFRAGTDCPPAIKKLAATELDILADGALPERSFTELEPFLAAAAKAGHELRAYDDALDFIAGKRDATTRALELRRLFPSGAADPKLLKILKVPLYLYQAEGALFALNAGRALIGDEMGLGKTIQAIAAAEIFARYFGVSKVLVICPTSLKYQWQSEIARFSTRTARVIGGPRVKRQNDFAEDDFCKITNYETLKTDLDLISDWGADLVIVDEAQRVKNWNTIAAKALKRINSPYAIVLTGTPLENKLEELISIVQFVDQHRLGPTWKLLHEHQVKDDTGRVTGYTRLDQIGQTLAPVVIRRRKSEVLLQLPRRTDQNLLVPMTEKQMDYHQQNAEIVSQIISRWQRLHFLSEVDQRRLTCALQNMRMSCNSTYLIDQMTDHGVKADELMALLGELFSDPDARAVVFSQWARTHDIIIPRLKNEGLGYVSFHGGIPSHKRPALIERFRTDPACRVFLSTDAGSTGLNLQHASTVVNMDLPWNPAVLEQRIGRVYRMGQKHPVRVINFVSKGTIEEGMLSTLAFKRSLAAGILDGGTGEISLGGTRLNRFMSDVQKVTRQMGDSATVSPAEEAGAAMSRPPRQPESATAPPTDANAAASRNEASPSAPAPASPSKPPSGTASTPAGSAPNPPSNPWHDLARLGMQFVAALASTRNSGSEAEAHPWIERDAATGRQNIKLPLPPPEIAEQLADALATLATSLRAGPPTSRG